MRHHDLVPAVLTISAAIAAFAWIAANVGTAGPLTSIDESVGAWLHQRAMPSLNLAMMAISLLGAPSTLTAISVVIGAVLARQHRYEGLAALMTLVLGGNLLNYGSKLLIHRGRPTFEDPLLTLTTYSFPSGHAVASTVFYGFVITCILTKTRRRRAGPMAAGILMIGLVCLSRVYLGVHYVSDVVAGILEGVAWSTLALAALRLVWPHERRSDSGRQAE